MKQVVQDFRTGDVRVEDVPPPALKEGFVRVKTVASVVSAGTERAIVSLAKKSLLGKARERPDLVKRVLRKMRRDGLVAAVHTVKDRLAAPLPLGYSSAGTVMETGRGAGRFVTGDLVACAGAGWANHAEESVVPMNLVAAVPAGVPAEQAAFATVGAIALNALRAGDVRIGDRWAIIGVGLLGTLALRIARAAGARVLAVDSDPLRRDAALADGAEVFASPSDAEAAVRAWTSRAGADAVLIAAGSPDAGPTSLAAGLIRRAGTVVALGDVPLHLDRRLYYAKEATLKVATSYGPGRYDRRYEEGGRDYPLAYVRWTAGRNLSAFLGLLASGSVRVADLIDPRPVEEATAVYDALLEGKPKGRAVVFTYSHAPSRTSAAPKSSAVAAKGLRTALIGAGAFGRGVLWPALASAGLVPSVVVTSSGPSAAEASRRLGFPTASTDASAAVVSPDVDVVVIATPHDSHSRLAASALRAGKHVFVEKPLAINGAGLEDVRAALDGAKGILTVGFNRRFSPAARRAKEFLDGVPGPSLLTYRVNAGPLAPGSWVGDDAVSGGRIIGEVCHMVDLAAFLTDEIPVRVAAAGARIGGEGASEDVALTIAFSRGSVATITYHAMGDPTQPKERIEIAKADRLAVIDDFRAVRLARDGKVVRKKLPSDKGHRAEAEAFVAAVTSGGPPPIPYDVLFAVTRATFAAIRALSSARFEDA